METIERSWSISMMAIYGRQSFLLLKATKDAETAQCRTNIFSPHSHPAPRQLTTGALEEVRSLTGRAPVLPKKRNRSEICQSKVLLREINAAMLTAEGKRFAS
jgi:hypothetical protein